MPEARAAIAKAVAKHKADREIANSLFVPAALADLAGQLMVHAYEEPHGREQRQLSLGEGQDTRAFLAMGWEEARAYFEERGLIRPKELERLLKRRATESVAAQDLLLQRVQERTYELLGDAIGDGSTYPEFAQQLREDAAGLGITTEDPAYLQTVFRTNVMDAYGEGRARALDHPAVVAARPYRQIRTANDGRVREEHAHADGMVFASDGPIAGLRAPFGFNCFPGRTVVQGTFEMGFRALYDGEIVEVTTKHGRRLTVTPNHPVATVHGFTAAGELREGDRLICYEGSVQSNAATAPERATVDEQHAPTTIEQVFRALATPVRGFTAHRRPEYFDGDAVGFQGDIDVVGADRELVRHDDPRVAQGGADVSLAATNAPGSVGEVGAGTPRSRLLRDDPPGAGAPSCAALPANGSGVVLQARPLHQFRFGPAASLHTARPEKSPDRAAADAEFVRQLLLADPTHVAPDEVVRVRKLQWRDHVYDLQSPFGWLVAEGIITTNCRCSVVSLASWDGEVVSEVPADLLTPGFGGL